MTIIDILIVVVLLTAAVLGFYRGIISQVSRIIAVVAGIVCARIFGEKVACFFAAEGSPDALELAAGYTIVFLAAYLLTWVVGRVLRSVVSTAKLGIIDRLAGAVFKTLLWALMLSLALNIYVYFKADETTFDDPRRPWRAFIMRLGPAVLGYLPQLKSLNTPDIFNFSHD